MNIKRYDEFNNYNDLLKLLNKYNVPVQEYGTKGFKTIGHLYNEIKEGETKLSEENGELIRKVSFVGVRVLYKKGDTWLRLYEEKQIFKDGRIRERKGMPFSAAEKFKEGEDPKKVIIRGMKEELDIEISSNQFTFYNKMVLENNDDFPGIRSFHTGYEFLIVLNDDQFEEDGYIEKQTDKDVYFKWKIIN